MKRIAAVILISLLVAPPASAGQKPGKPIRWEKVTRLKTGTEIMLAVSDNPPTTLGAVCRPRPVPPAGT